MIIQAVPLAMLVAGVVASLSEQTEACIITVTNGDIASTVLDCVSIAIGVLALLVAILQLQEHRRLRPRLQAQQAEVFELAQLLPGVSLLLESSALTDCEQRLARRRL